MEYVYILIAVLGIGGLFVMTKAYQTKCGNGAKALIGFSFWFAIGGFFFSFFANCCRIDFALVTFCLSLVVAIAIGFDNVAGVVALKYCKMSLYTTFIMAGGMVIPSFFGVLFLSETLSVWRISGIIAVIIALIVPVFEKTGERTSKIGLLLCVAVFVSNGLNNVASKIHQINETALTTQDFLIWINIWYFILAAAFSLIYFTIKKNGKGRETDNAEKTPINLKAFLLPILWILLTSVVSATGQSFNLLAAKTADASLMYPLITGGGMVLSAVSGRIFFKEKITKLNAISLMIAVVGTVLFAI